MCLSILWYNIHSQMANNFICFQMYIQTHTEYDLQKCDYVNSRLQVIIRSLGHIVMTHKRSLHAQGQFSHSPANSNTAAVEVVNVISWTPHNNHVLNYTKWNSSIWKHIWINAVILLLFKSLRIVWILSLKRKSTPLLYSMSCTSNPIIEHCFLWIVTRNKKNNPVKRTYIYFGTPVN